MSDNRPRGFFGTMPAWLRWTLILSLVYVLSPIDLRPDFLPGIGWIDDVLVIALALYLFRTWHRGRLRKSRRRDVRTVVSTARVADAETRPPAASRNGKAAP